MEVKLPVLVMLAMALSLFSAASAEQVPRAVACPNFAMKKSGVMIGGAGDELGNNGTACRQMQTVRCAKPCKDGVITVKAADCCRQPCKGVINLSRDAFSRIADLDAGEVWVDYA